MRNDKGFTLIELLVVIAIIGILAAIAIPQFAEYRARGFDARARSDLRNVATAEEAYFVDNEQYVATVCTDTGCTEALPGVSRASVGTTVTILAPNPETAFTGTSENDRGTDGVIYNWDSEAGGMQ